MNAQCFWLSSQSGQTQITKNTGVVQAGGDGVVQAAHRRSWCFCVCGVWLALELVRIGFQMKRGFFGLITLTPKSVSYTHLTLPTICSV